MVTSSTPPHATTELGSTFLQPEQLKVGVYVCMYLSINLCIQICIYLYLYLCVYAIYIYIDLIIHESAFPASTLGLGGGRLG